MALLPLVGPWILTVGDWNKNRFREALGNFLERSQE
jgi:hypothetical protein